MNRFVSNVVKRKQSSINVMMSLFNVVTISFDSFFRNFFSHFSYFFMNFSKVFFRLHEFYLLKFKSSFSIFVIEFKRIIESILKQINWKKIAWYVISNKQIKIYKIIILKLLQDKIDEFFDKKKENQIKSEQKTLKKKKIDWDYRQRRLKAKKKIFTLLTTHFVFTNFQFHISFS